MPFPYVFPFFFHVITDMPPDYIYLESWLNDDTHLASRLNEDVPMMLSPLMRTLLLSSR